MSARRDHVRFAVVGLGSIAQHEVLPAFAGAESADLVALVSGSEDKRNEAAERYKVNYAFGYDDFETALERSGADAVYIALPNHLHCEYTVRAAAAGVHVLCEKPMAVTEEECRRMIDACHDAHVSLMIAYRLHFERANLEAIEVLRRGDIGDARLFDSVFVRQVEEGDVRLMPVSRGGGTVYDLGVYCINAARYLFRDEPIEVVAACNWGEGARFEESDEMTSAALRFPDGRLASFTTSFNGGPVSTYRVVGTQGELIMDPAYDYDLRLGYEVRAGEHYHSRRFETRDQFAAELQYFADRLLRDEQPEPDGYEGLADVRIVQAVYEAARTGRRIAITPIGQRERPGLEQEVTEPAR